MPFVPWRVIRMKAEAGLTSESANAPLRRTAAAMRNRFEVMAARPPLLDGGVDLRLAVDVELGLDAVEERVERLVSRDLGPVHRAVRRERLQSVDVVTDVLDAVLVRRDGVL